MAVDDDAQAVLDALTGALPDGLGGLGVQEARAALAGLAAAVPPGPALHATTDLEAGGVPVRVYAPSADPGLPILVYLHGGAFALGDLDSYNTTCAELAVGAEALVVSVAYRLAPEDPFPAGVEDAYAATAWVAEHAAELGGDPSRVAIGGDSAGATLAAAVALMARDRSGPALAAQLLVYPTTLMRVANPEYSDMPLVNASTCERYWQLYASDADRRSPYCAPMRAEDVAGLPPAFVVVPEVDPTRDDQEAYARRMAEAGVLTTCKRYPGSYHGFLTATFAVARAREAMADATAWLRAVLTSAS